MNRAGLIAQIRAKKSYLCIGLDTDIEKIPPHLLQYENPVLEFNKAIIEATADICVAYKPNIAFFEALGTKGWEILEATKKHIPADCFTIADAKRGDIGNTSAMYAKAFLQDLDFDSITVAPYMGEDSVTPFWTVPEKWAIVLGLTSNKGSADFQRLTVNGMPLFEKVMRTVMQWGSPENLMFVIGATHPDDFSYIRSFCPDHFFLVPGVGAQGGDLNAISEHGINKDIGLLVNATRSVIYASKGKDFAEKAREEALAMREEMQKFL